MREKTEPKLRQHTIDLSQMAVPIQMAQEKRQSPESPGQSQGEAELLTEYIPAGTSRNSIVIKAHHSLMDGGSGVPAEKIYIQHAHVSCFSARMIHPHFQYQCQCHVVNHDVYERLKGNASLHLFVKLTSV